MQLPDGDYHDLLTDSLVGVTGGTMTLPTDAAILRVDTPLAVTPMTFDLLDYQPADLSS